MNEGTNMETGTTELGMEVPVKPGDEYREHTAERWRVRDAASYEYCLFLIRQIGIVNRSELHRMVSEHRQERGLAGISRNCIIALINDPQEFKPGEINEIIARQAALLAMESAGAARELVDQAKSTKDLGAVTMALTAAHNVKQLSSGGPTQHKVVTHKFDLDDFEAMRMRQTQAPVLPETIRDAVKLGAVLEAEESVKFENDRDKATAK